MDFHFILGFDFSIKFCHPTGRTVESGGNLFLTWISISEIYI